MARIWQPPTGGGQPPTGGWHSSVRVIFRMVIALAIAPLSFACRPARPIEPGNERFTTPKHWVEDEHLRAAMKKIETIPWPANLPQDPEAPESPSERKTAFREAAQLAQSLAESASRIPNSTNLAGMSEADRNAFLNYAEALQSQASQLEQATHRGQVEPMQQSLDAIRSTCVSCHTRFRDLTGGLAPPRA